MNYFQYPYGPYRQFNLPAYLGGQLLGYLGGQWLGPPGGPFPGASYPGFPGGSSPGIPGGENVSAPESPPPAFTPEKPFQTFAIDPGAIRGCLYRFTYVWLRRDSFWFFPIFVGRQSVAGFRWVGYRWVYYGIDVDRIESFQCY